MKRVMMTFSTITRQEASVVVELPDDANPEDYIDDVFDALDGAVLDQFEERGDLSKVEKDEPGTKFPTEFRVNADGIVEAVQS